MSAAWLSLLRLGISAGRPDAEVGSRPLNLAAVIVVSDQVSALAVRAQMTARDSEDDHSTGGSCADAVAVSELQRDTNDRRTGLTDDEDVPAGGLNTEHIDPGARCVGRLAAGLRSADAEVDAPAWRRDVAGDSEDG